MRASHQTQAGIGHSAGTLNPVVRCLHMSDEGGASGQAPLTGLNMNQPRLEGGLEPIGKAHTRQSHGIEGPAIASSTGSSQQNRDIVTGASASF